METLKIAFYTDSYLPSIDGVVAAILSARKELERRGHEVYIFAAGNGETEKIARNDKNIVVMKGLKFPRYPQYTIAIPSIYSERIRMINPDVIHAHTPFSAGVSALMAKRSTGASLVSTFHTIIFSDQALAGYMSGNRLAIGVAKSAILKYLKWFYNRNDAVIAPSNFVRALLSKNGIKNIHLVPNGVDFSGLKRVGKTAARRRLGIRKTDRVILYFGRIGAEKNLEFLVRAAHVMNDGNTTVVLAGTGPNLRHLENVNHMLKNKCVKFVGFVPNRLVPYYYSAADVFCNPSLFENQSTVDLYAAGYRLPLLVPDGTAQTEMLSYQNCGLRFNPNSISDLADKLGEAYESRKKFKFNKIVGEFDIKNTVDGLLSLYNKVV